MVFCLMRRVLFWRTRLQLQRVQCTPHGLPERLIDELMLLNLGLSREFRGNNTRRKMIIVVREGRNLDCCVRYTLLDQPFYLCCFYGHSSFVPPRLC